MGKRGPKPFKVTAKDAELLERLCSGKGRDAAKQNCVGSQADRIIKKFGGAGRLARLFKAMGYGRNASSIHRWNYPRERKGRGGVIPAQAWPALFQAARLEGIVITPEDLDPRVVKPYRVDVTRKLVNANPKQIHAGRKEFAYLRYEDEDSE